MPGLARALGTTALLGAAGLTYAYLEAQAYTLRHVEVPLLDRGERPLRVLHLSDLHLTPSQERKIAWVRALATLEPDLVVDTGDNMAHVDALPPLLDALEPLLRFPGAFVMGSNDYFAPVPRNPVRYLLGDSRRAQNPDHTRLPADELARELTAAGWVDLDNHRAVVEAGGRRIAMVGVDDPHIDRDRFPLRPVDPEPADLRFGVTHAPYRRVLDAMHADGADLVLAGHTHGGQLCVPGFGALVTNCDVDRRRAKGLHGWPGPRPDEAAGGASTWLHVSAGLGTSPYAPVRFACRPEATLVELVPRA